MKKLISLIIIASMLLPAFGFIANFNVAAATAISSLPDIYEPDKTTDLIPPVGDQGGEGACASFAVAYYYKSIQEKK